MPQVNGKIVKERAARLRAKGEAAMADYRASRIGREANVLVEQDDAGHCEHYLPVRLTEPTAPGLLRKVRITGSDATHLHGTPIA
jgi:threonylcarbamoyladenosine tRNA methylthiotransferase MtaB